MDRDEQKSKITVVALIAVIVVLVASGLYLLYDINDNSLDISGREARLVVTGSMDAGETDNPISTIPINSLVMVRHLSEDELSSIKVGDVIAYDRSGYMIVHRVIEIEDDYFVTQGDANPSADSAVYHDRVIGKVIGVSPFLGKIVTLAKEKAVWIIVFIICAVVMIYSVREIIRIYSEEKEDERNLR